MTILGDSGDYDLLTYAVNQIKKQEGDTYNFSLEVGVREGAGSATIMEAFLNTFKDKPYHHVGVDPYGNLSYQHYDKSGAYQCDYTDEMYIRLLKNFSTYPNFHLVKLTDEEYMKRYADGFPVFNNGQGLILNQYDLIHLDGPHTTRDVILETAFFAPKVKVGGILVYDDWNTFEFHIIDQILKVFNFKQLTSGEHKIVYQCQSPNTQK